MKKPRPLDFELNENKIHEIEWKIKELSKRNRKLTKRVHGWLIAGFFLMFALLMFKDFEYHAPLIAFFPAIIFGISIAKFAVKYYTQSIHKPQFTKDLDYQNYLEYIRAKRDYENQYRGSKRARWGQLQKKDFETEVISLLYCDKHMIR
ncbi:hypothetical protein GWN91_06610 [Candidatus Saccharibacteria bacterium]|nr:hypothetical protein [Candidatus Saccharibacteria bacterium]NIW80266.1 hypothetical protein [Calditrichia bacterium]